MKQLLLIFALLCPSALGQILDPILFGGGLAGTIGTCGSATGYSNTLTVTVSTQSGFSGSGLTNWRSLFIGDSHLKTTGNGGYSLSSGTDIVPCTAEDGTGTIIPYRLVSGSYVATTGALEMQIKFPAINKSSTAKFYFIVGKASATDFSCTAAANCATTLFANLNGGTNAILRHYDFGSAGSVAYLTDGTGNAASPTNHGGSQGTSSPIINAYTTFAGGNNYTDSGSTLPALTNFSIEAWAKMASNPGAGETFPASNSDSTATGGVFLIGLASGGACTSSNRECIGAGYHSTASNFYLKTTNAFVDGIGWFHIAGSHTAGSPNITIYLNGAVDTGTVGSSGTANDPGTTTSTFQIGRFGDFSTPFYYNCATCVMDELEVMNFPLTADEVLFDNNNQGNPTSTYTVSAP